MFCIRKIILILSPHGVVMRKILTIGGSGRRARWTSLPEHVFANEFARVYSSRLRPVRLGCPRSTTGMRHSYVLRRHVIYPEPSLKSAVCALTVNLTTEKG
jgi:hypothetical protein